MAPSKKASARKEGRKAARNPPTTAGNVTQSRQRSASPTDQPTPIHTRGEPPAHSTATPDNLPVDKMLHDDESTSTVVDDPVRKESTSNPPRTPITPPLTSPLVAEPKPLTSPSTESPNEQKSQSPAETPTPGTPTPANLTAQNPNPEFVYQPRPHSAELMTILQHLRGWTYRRSRREEDPDLPSLAMRPPVTEYMRQFEEEETDEFFKPMW